MGGLLLLDLIVGSAAGVLVSVFSSVDGWAAVTVGGFAAIVVNLIALVVWSG